MPRNALKVFFERVIIASLPLAVAPGCGTKQPKTTGPQTQDMAVTTSGPNDGGVQDMTNSSNGPTDMAKFVGNDLSDPCDVFGLTKPPLTDVIFPAKYVPDGGAFLVSGHPVPSIICAGDMGSCLCIELCPAPYNACGSHDIPVDMAGQAGSPAYHGTCSFVCGGVGRRPEGLAEATPTSGCATGTYFATQAHLEAASVRAFRVLAKELEAHGAPARLIAAAKRAAGDEVRHARLTRRLARAHGTPLPKLTVAKMPKLRSLEAIALENAAEGCVRETFGALVATWQSRAAADPSVRALMADIAEDETRHAQLAWDVDAWLKRKVDRQTRQRIDETRRHTAEELMSEMKQPFAPELVRNLGLPDVDRATQFAAAARQALWS